jgi:hypothetical protein
MWAPAVRSPETAFAAYGLAVRITQDERRAVGCLELARRQAPGETGAAFLRRVRSVARLHRAAPPDAATALRPPALADVAYGEWAVLERVALRGMTLTEAAAALEIERGEALRRLSRGLRAARGCLSRDGYSGDDAQAAGDDVLGVDLASRGLDDPPRDRQAQPAAAADLG